MVLEIVILGLAYKKNVIRFLLEVIPLSRFLKSRRIFQENVFLIKELKLSSHRLREHGYKILLSYVQKTFFLQVHYFISIPVHFLSFKQPDLSTTVILFESSLIKFNAKLNKEKNNCSKLPFLFIFFLFTVMHYAFSQE